MVNSDKLADIRAERGVIYGDPVENHRGIAQGWAALLQPHWQAIRNGEPLPIHVVVLLIASLKLNRMRLAFHQDNYDDIANYLGFAEQWQKEYDEQRGRHRRTLPTDRPLRIYVAGPYSAPTQAERDRHIERAMAVGKQLAERGHLVHVPHCATAFLDGTMSYEEILALDFTVLHDWADTLYFDGPSPGANRERAFARIQGHWILESIEDVPNLRTGMTGEMRELPAAAAAV